VQPSTAFQAVPEPLMAIAVKIPSSWTANKDIRNDVKVLTTNNFNGEYLHGGIIPQKGAEIAVIADASAKSQRSLDTLISEYLRGDENLSNIAKIKVAGCEAKHVTSETVFMPELSYKRAAVFMRLRHKDSEQVYKFILSYNSAEGSEISRAFKTAFDGVLKSVTLILPDSTDCVSSPAK
jgi:hypothetical protein